MSMFRPVCVILLTVLVSSFLPAGISSAQVEEMIGSEHVRMRLPAERAAMGRDLAPEMERCYIFMNRSTGQSLPRKILIVVDWDQPDSSCNPQDATITVGMANLLASADLKGILLHRAAKEMARLGLLEFSAGAQREDTEFLFEGMAEILVHEYEHRSRSLEGAWVICQYLDNMKLLGVATERSWTEFSSGKRCFRNAAPGITLLTASRELQGRDAPLKLFESLRRNSLSASLAAVFKTSAAEAENGWLKKVRAHQAVDEITIAPEDVPLLLQTALTRGSVKPGETLEIQLFLKSPQNNLLPEGVFFRDERTGRVEQAHAPSEKGTSYLLVKLPIDANCPPGDYSYEVTAIDESGNLRRWPGRYKVGN